MSQAQRASMREKMALQLQVPGARKETQKRTEAFHYVSSQLARITDKPVMLAQLAGFAFTAEVSRLLLGKLIT